jgi:D-3-phosphoglycerate dehydrogenase / 2-oxoglutarate reductase
VKVIVLDSLYSDLALEEEAASAAGASLEAWDGDPDSLADADVVAHVRTRVDAALIAAMPRCRVIARFGTGLDTVDLEAAAAAGIAVRGVRDYCLPELASQTLAIGFCLLRRIRETAGLLDATWSEEAARHPLQRREDAAVVGFGSVGRRVAGALLALGYRVTVATEHAPEEAAALGAEVAPLDAALRGADIVFLHAALTAATERLIDARRLASMRSGAILVDTARLGLVDEEAVAAALDDGRLGGLGLDASLPPGSPLRRFAGDPRVLITPHLGWYSETSAAELRRRTIAEALDLARQTDDLEVRSR